MTKERINEPEISGKCPIQRREKKKLKEWWKDRGRPMESINQAFQCKFNLSTRKRRNIKNDRKLLDKIIA